MKKGEENKNFQSSFLGVDAASLLREYDEGEQVGQTSRIQDLDDVFKWMPGNQQAFYGWANDGKGTFYDFLAVMKAKFDGWKFCMMKQEDISSTRYKKEAPKITANRIFKGLVWSYTGKTPYKGFAEKNKIQQIPKDEYMDALEWAQDHFYIMYPKDRAYRAVMDNFKFAHEKWGINAFLIDPWKSLNLSAQDSKRSDWLLDDLFIENKEFAVKTNSVMDYIAHPKSLTDVRDGKGQDAPFKVVTQFMIAGGAAWDNNMDAQYSIYRPERHLNARDPRVEFHNLKQRNNEEVGAQRGVYKGITFDRLQRRYFFKGICPIDGSIERGQYAKTAPIDFGEPIKNQQPIPDGDMPF
jgi:hypothetical protein